MRSRRSGLEALEPRLLLSLSAGGYAAAAIGFGDIDPPHVLAGDQDVEPPEASLRVPDITTAGGETHTLTVTYTDNVAIDVSGLDNRDLLVIGRHLRRHATFVSVDHEADRTPRTATYTVDAPGGTWDAADNGTYWVIMGYRQVSDTSGNHVRPRLLGRFTVEIDRPHETLWQHDSLPGRHDRGPSSRAARDHLFRIGAFG